MHPVAKKRAPSAVASEDVQRLFCRVWNPEKRLVALFSGGRFGRRVIPKNNHFQLRLDTRSNLELHPIWSYLISL
jgi:hypothetical protein